MLIDDTQLKVNIVDENSKMKSRISLFDDNISLLRKGSNSMLASFSIQKNKDNGYNLDFDVKKKVNVSFVYNEAISTYEVHLEKGSGGEISYSRTFEKQEGQQLKIDFVNHIGNARAKTLELIEIRKPIIIIDN